MTVGAHSRFGSGLRPLASIAVAAMLVIACGAPAGTAAPSQPNGSAPASAGSGGEAVTLNIRLNPSNVAVAVAQEEGLFENLNVDYTLVGYGESAQLFLASDDPIGHESPWEVARFISEGEDIVFFSTSAALNFWNGVIIRDADSGEYADIEDLFGKKLGHPGFGTGTWQAFDILMQTLYGVDAETQFELVQADPGALLGLLETGEIDGALNFAGQSATAMASDTFDLLFSFTEAWQEAEGQPLTINGLIARRDWLEDNVDVAKRFIAGSEAGLQWMKDNPDEFRPDGKYAEWTAGEGWHRDEATTDLIIDRLQAGEWYLSHDQYTQEWIDSTYEFVEQGEGVFAETVPPKDEVYFDPALLEGD